MIGSYTMNFISIKLMKITSTYIFYLRSILEKNYSFKVCSNYKGFHTF